MRTPAEIRRHAVEVEQALADAFRDGTVNEVVVRDYIRASVDVQALDDNEAECAEVADGR